MTALARLNIDPVERLNFSLCAAVVALSAALASPVFTVSVAVGALLEAVNFRALRRSATRLLSGEIAGSGPWTAIFVLRFTLLAVGMYIALDAGAHPVGLILGLSIIVPAVVINAWRTPPPMVSTDDVPPPDDPSWDEWNPWLARERDPREEDEIS